MRSNVLPQIESVVEAFATATFDRQLERFHDRFGRIPLGNDPVFFRPGLASPQPMSPQEILALVTGDALEGTVLPFDTVESAREFAILVLVQLGLPADDAEDARTRSGRFALH